MSLLEGLKRAKKGLKATETLITRADGTQILERHDSSIEIQGSRKYGFVIDTKPDQVPAKIIEHLYLGSQDCTDPSILAEYNITHVLSLGIEIECPSDFVYKFVPCLDLPETNLLQEEILRDCITFMECAIKQQRNVLVHCNAGISRSPSVVIGYLIIKCDMSYQDAYEHCQRLRSTIRPNDGFVKQLQQLSAASSFILNDC